MGRERGAAARRSWLPTSPLALALCGIWALAHWRSWALAATLATVVAAAELPGKPSESTPCTSFLEHVSEEFLGLAFDTLGRFAATADFRVEAKVDRVATIIARDLVDGLLQLTEAGYLYFCHLSRCGKCLSESSGEEPDGLRAEIGLQGRFGLLMQRLRSFLSIWDEKLTGLALLSEEQAARVQAIRAAVERSVHEEVLSQMEAQMLKADLSTDSSGGGGGSIEDLVMSAVNFRKLIASLHGAVTESLDLLSGLVHDSKLKPRVASAITSPSALSAYVRTAASRGSEETEDRSGGSSPIWPQLVQLAQDRLRPTMPFMRASVLCDAEGESLYRQGALPAALDDAPPFRDSSGAHTWHSLPARTLLEALAHAGHRPSYKYWSLLPKGMYQRTVPCSEAHGMLYDPTACLEEAGWGGHAFFLSISRASKQDDEGGHEEHTSSESRRQNHLAAERPLKYKAALQMRQRPRTTEGGEASGAAHGSKLESTAWPPEPPHEPVDVLFLHPMAGNCGLLPDVLTSDRSPVRLLYVPINPTLPPPLRAAPDFTQYWERHILWAKEAVQEHGTQMDDLVYRSMSYHFLAQCSLAQVVELLQPRNFELLHVEHLYAVFAQRSVAAPLQRRGSQVHQGDLHRALGPLFEAWRLGWFCSPVSRYALSLEELAQMDPASLGVQDDASAARAVCAFLARQGLTPGALMGSQSCSQADAGLQQEAEATAGEFAGRPSRWRAALAQRQRMQWALELRDPLPGVSRYLGHGPSAASGSGGPGGTCLAGPRSALPRGLCRGTSCECFAPYRGPRCDQEDAGFHSGSQARPFDAAIHYIVNDEPVHVAELLHALRNLWRRFNSRYDYPVLIFHDGLPPQVRIQIILAAPHRIWFHHVPDDFLPAPKALPPDLLEEDEKGEFSHHSFSAGYRAQSRFRAGPVFAHPAVMRLDYLWSLDTDSMFPADLQSDPFEAMHGDESLVLGYEYITVTSSTSSKNFWEVTLPYIVHKGIDVLAAVQDKTTFLKRFLMLPQGWDAATAWNNKVVMTDCELLRVSFFCPGTEYYEYFRYLDALQGFWLYRWGDHAVRGLGTALAIQRHNSSGDAGATPRPKAYPLLLPYAHQNSCFCEDRTLKCVKLGIEASGEPLWPPKKSIWECQLNETAVVGA